MNINSQMCVVLVVVVAGAARTCSYNPRAPFRTHRIPVLGLADDSIFGRTSGFAGSLRVAPNRRNGLTRNEINAVAAPAVDSSGIVRDNSVHARHRSGLCKHTHTHTHTHTHEHTRARTYTHKYVYIRA
eukprot:1295305-Pyramimonas_sp.AAC.1